MSHRLRLPALGLLLGLILLLGSASADSAAPPPRLIRPAHVSAMEVSPDSRYAIYLFGPDLYSYNLATRATAQLNPALAANWRINPDQVQISADSSRVVFIAQLAADPKPQLYSALIAGGTAAKLNPELAGAQQIQTFRLSLDGQHALYVVVSDADPSAAAIWRVPTEGGAASVLTPPLAAGTRLGPQIGRVGTHILYRIHTSADPFAPVELYSVPLAGGPPLLRGSQVINLDRLQITADGNTVVYIRAGAAHNEAWAAAVAGGDPYRLALPESFIPAVMTIDDAGRKVAVLSQDRKQLYGTSLDAGNTAFVRLDNGGGSVNIGKFELAPDGSRALYSRDAGINVFAVELYSAAMTDGATVKLSGPQEADWGGVGTFKISPDSRTVVYVGDELIDSSGSKQLYSVPLSGGQPARRISGPALTYAAYPETSLSFTSDSAEIVYRGWNTDQRAMDLLRVPVDGSLPPLKLNPGVTSVGEYDNGRDYYNYRATPDGRYIVFRGGPVLEDFPALALYVQDREAVGHRLYLPLAGR